MKYKLQTALRFSITGTMGRKRMRGERLVIGALALALAAGGGAGCGNADPATKRSVCSTLEDEIASFTAKVAQKTNDPDGAAAIYHESATKFRTEGERAGGAIKAAATDIGKELDKVADAVKDRQQEAPDMSALTTAGSKLKDACA
jgi:hypothetical protein